MDTMLKNELTTMPISNSNSNEFDEIIKIKFRAFDNSEFYKQYRFEDFITYIPCRKNEKFTEVCKRFGKRQPFCEVEAFDYFYEYFFENRQISKNKDLTIGQIGLKNNSEILAIYHNKVVG